MGRKMKIEFTENEIYLLWDSVNKNILDHLRAQKKAAEKWKKENILKEIRELEKLQKFFGDLSKKIIIERAR